jgi:hypothetical protein
MRVFANKIGGYTDNKNGRILAFLESARAVVLEKGEKWGRSSVAKFFRKVFLSKSRENAANKKALKLRHLLIRVKILKEKDSAPPVYRYQYFLEQYGSGTLFAWQLLSVGDFSYSMNRKIVAQAVPCLGVPGSETFLEKNNNKRREKVQEDLAPWVKNGCGKRKPCICIALDHAGSYNEGNNQALIVLPFGAQRVVNRGDPRIMRAVIPEDSDFFLVLKHITQRRIQGQS